MGILNNLFSRNGDPAGAPRSEAVRARLKAIEGAGWAKQAGSMLGAPNSPMRLNREEARVVVAYMKPRKIANGTTFIREGDSQANDFMLLILDGEVTVENFVVSRTEPITVGIHGPGSLIGEMGLVDGEPRSASCTALSDLRCACMTRQDLMELLEEDPRVAAKLLLAIATRIAARMRDSQDKLKMYAQLTQAMNEEMKEAR